MEGLGWKGAFPNGVEGKIILSKGGNLEMRGRVGVEEISMEGGGGPTFPKGGN